MACKNSIPMKKCGDCHYMDPDTYRGAGVKVCYELQRDDSGRKVAIQVTENKKGCNKHRVSEKTEKAG